MAKARSQSPAKRQTSEEDRITGPSTRNSPRKASTSAKRAPATGAKSAQRVTKKTTPRRAPITRATQNTSTKATSGKASPSPGKAKAMSKTGPTSAAIRNASPSKTTTSKASKPPSLGHAKRNEQASRMRGDFDEDDSGYEPRQSTDQLLAAFDGRTRTRDDKSLVEEIRRYENGDDMSLELGKSIAHREMFEEDIKCHYHIYWRYRKYWEENFDREWPYPQPHHGVVQSVEGRGSRSPSSKGKSRGPTRSPNKLANAPNLSPSKTSASIASPKNSRARDPAFSPRQKQAMSGGRAQNPKRHPRAKESGIDLDLQHALRTHADASEQASIDTYADSGVPLSKTNGRIRKPNTPKVRGEAPLRSHNSRSSPGTDLRTPGSTHRRLAITPHHSPARPSASHGEQRGEHASHRPAMETYVRQYYENDQFQFGADKDNRGYKVPPVQRDWVEVSDLKHPKKKPTDRRNPFFETMPGPEVWHRRIPPYFPFGETPYMEKIMSDQINQDLARTNKEHTEETTPKPPSGWMESFASFPGNILDSVFGRSPDRTGKKKAEEKPPKTAAQLKEMLQPPSWPWHLPSVEEVLPADGVTSTRKRSAGSQVSEPGSPSKRRKH